MKPATEILLSAAFALTPEENWTTGVWARNETGCYEDPTSPRACSFCVQGALFAAIGRDPSFLPLPDTLHEPYQYLRMAMGRTLDIGEWNNTHTHAEVLDALYRAAEISEAS